MPHDISLIATITMGLVLAFIGGLVAHRLRLPPLVGYLLAGVALGPFTPGFVGDANLASQLAEIGVILLMFGVGLHFSIRDLLAVRAIALPEPLRRSPSPRRAAWRSRFCGAGDSARDSYLAWRCRLRALSCCCGRWSSAIAWIRSTVASRSDG
jgi:Sodium/hydrogen exchanger family